MPGDIIQRKAPVPDIANTTAPRLIETENNGVCHLLDDGRPGGWELVDHSVTGKRAVVHLPSHPQAFCSSLSRWAISASR